MKTRSLLIIFAIASTWGAMAQNKNTTVLKEEKQFHLYKIYSHKGRVNASSNVWLICKYDQSRKNYKSLTLYVEHLLNPGPGTPQYYIFNDTTFLTKIPINGKVRLKYTLIDKYLERKNFNDNNILEDKGLRPLYETTVKFNGKKSEDKALKAKVKLKFIDRDKAQHYILYQNPIRDKDSKK